MAASLKKWRARKAKDLEKGMKERDAKQKAVESVRRSKRLARKDRRKEMRQKGQNMSTPSSKGEGKKSTISGSKGMRKRQKM